MNEPGEASAAAWPAEWPAQEQLFRVALAVCHDPHLADDLAAEAALRAMVKLDSEVDGQQTRWSLAWFRTVIGNLFADERRRSSSSRTSSVGPEEFELHIAPTASVEEQAERKELLAMVRESIDELPVQLREVILHRFVLGHSVAATERALQVSTRTVERNFAEGLEILRRKFSARSVGAVPVPLVLARSARLVPAKAAAGVGLGTAAALIVALVLGALVGPGILGLLRSTPAAAGSARPDVVVSGLYDRDVAGAVPRAEDVPGLPGLDRSEEATAGRAPRAGIQVASPDPPTAPGEGALADTVPEVETPVAQLFRLRLIVDGHPAAGWKTYAPRLDPDASADGRVLGPVPFAPMDEEGWVEFEMETFAGTWLFELEPPDTPHVAVRCLLEPQALGVPHHTLRFDTGALTVPDLLERLPSDLDLESLVVESNPQTGLWVLCRANGIAPMDTVAQHRTRNPHLGPGLTFPFAAAGPQRLRTMTRLMLPDSWPEPLPAWTVDCLADPGRAAR